MAHAWPEELKQEIGEINAKKVVPVHTEAQEKFKEMGGKVVMVEVGKEVKV